jgi:hypothetical protein
MTFVMTFDRLAYIDRLKQGGVQEPIARAHADALREALFESVATKADLNLLRTDLNEAIAKLSQRIDAVRAELDHKIELLGRDLTIKGAAGLVILASILIGLKLFG